jgi:hypothetical protein
MAGTLEALPPCEFVEKREIPWTPVFFVRD